MGLYEAPDALHQLEQAEDEIAAVIGRKPTLVPAPLRRVLGRYRDDRDQLALPDHMWDIEFNQHGDSAGSNVERLSRLAGPGSIILGHDGGTLNCEVVVEALPALIDRLRARGLGFVTVSELLASAGPPVSPGAGSSAARQTRQATHTT